MKKLSIEEKAKAYDKAIKVANKYKDTYIMFPQIKDEMFPELKESEDEKIRKSIIAILNNYVDNSNTFKPKMIDWLEKQIQVCLSYDDEIMIRQLTEYFTTGKGLQNTNDTVVEWLANVKRKLEKQGEQTSDKVDPCHTCDHPTMSCNDFPCERKQEEQKLTEWSEVDEHWRQKAIDFLEHPDLIKVTPTLAKYTIDWLKSLKPQKGE